MPTSASIQVSDPLSLQQGVPLDVRTNFDTVPLALAGIPLVARYDGLEVWIVSEQKKYYFHDSLADTDFDPVPGATITRQIPATTTVGGYNPGDIVTPGTTIDEFADKLLNVYQIPTFTALATSLGTGTKECGSVFNSYNITWSTSNSGNVKPNTIVITINGTQVATGEANDGIYASTTAINRDTPGNVAIAINGTNTHDQAITTRSINIAFAYPIYYGESESSANLTSANILALRASKLQTSALGDYAFEAFGTDGNSYKWIAIPASYTQPTSFKLNGLPASVMPAFTVSVTKDVAGGHTVTTDYKVYRSENELGAETINLS
jgi:hypothetical protein